MVGTAFNVKNYDSVTEVIVENGIVKVGYNNQVIELYKGEKTVIKNTGGTLEKTKITDSLYNYYRTKSIVCNDTPIAAINEAYNAKVVLGDEALNHLLLSATFNNEDLETIISIIQQTFNLQVERKGNSIILYSN